MFVTTTRCDPPAGGIGGSRVFPTALAQKLEPHMLINQPHWRIRTDTVDVRGHVCLRYLGRQRHLNVGWKYRGQQIRLYVLDDVVTFATEDGEFIGETKIDPERN